MENELVEQRLKKAFVYFNLSKTQQFFLETYSNLIKIKHEPTYYHSARMALYGIRVSKITTLDPRMMLYVDLLHDVGKTVVDKNLLVKPDFNAADHKKMEKHSLYGYYLLRGAHDFFAEVILRHHRYGPNGYPKRLPAGRVSFSNASRELIDQYAMVLSIIDFYDAAVTRQSDYHGIIRFNTRKEVKALLVEHFPNQSGLIEFFYKKGVFDELI